MHIAAPIAAPPPAAWQFGDPGRAEVERLLDKVRTHLGMEVAWVSGFAAGEPGDLS